MTEQKDSIIQDMIQAAIRAGSLAVKKRNKGLQVDMKGDLTPQTNADTLADKSIKRDLRKYGFGFFTEESGREGAPSDDEWVVDPIDGTLNFKDGTDPSWAVSIALKEKGEITRAVTYMPETGKIYWAGRGKGAIMQHVGTKGELGPEIKLDITNKGEPNHILELTGSYLTKKNIGIRSAFIRAFEQGIGTKTHQRDVGCSAVGLAHLAAGGRGAYVQMGVKEYDIAAAALIAKEAGAEVLMESMKDGSDNFSIIAAHPKVFGKLLDVYKHVTSQEALRNGAKLVQSDQVGVFT